MATLYQKDGTAVELPDNYSELPQKLTEAESRIGELEKEVNPNWREARQRMTELEKESEALKALNAQGKTLNEKGEVVPLAQPLNPEQVQEHARTAARQEIMSERIASTLSRFDEAQRKVIQQEFDMLSAAKPVTTMEDLESTMARAIHLSQMPTKTNPLSDALGVHGAAPRHDEETKEPSATVQGLADSMGLNIKTKENS